jgi:hypothetical protein
LRDAFFLSQYSTSTTRTCFIKQYKFTDELFL